MCSGTQVKGLHQISVGRGVRRLGVCKIPRQSDNRWDSTSSSPQVRNGADTKQEQINKRRADLEREKTRNGLERIHRAQKCQLFCSPGDGHHHHLSNHKQVLAEQGDPNPDGHGI